MPTDLSTSIAFLKNRIDKTLSTQEEIAETWLWPVKTVAEWEADSLQLDQSQDGTLARKAILADAALNGARGLLDARLAELHRQSLIVVGVMRVRAARDATLVSVVDELSARGQARKEIEDEASLILAAWEEEFNGPAFTPAAGITFAGFEALIEGAPAPAGPVVLSLRQLRRTLDAKGTIARREVGRVNALLERVQKDGVDWYAEVTAVYAVGTEIGDLVRANVPTSSDYGPNDHGGGGNPPVG